MSRKRNEEQLYINEGKRLRDAFAHCGVKQKDIAELLDVEPVSVSRYVNGWRKMTPAQYDILARSLELRVEYLKGIDDFKTNDDIKAAAQSNSAELLESRLKYLESIGCMVSTRIVLHIRNLDTLVNHWDAIRDTLTDGALEFRVTPDSITIGEWDGITPADLNGMDRICVAADPADTYPDRWGGYPFLDDLFYDEGLPVKTTLPVFDNSECPDCDAFYEISYILQQDETEKSFTSAMLNRLFDVIDSHARIVMNRAMRML